MKYKTAYVVQASGHDFSNLKDIADEIVFITTGYEEEIQLVETINNRLMFFNEEFDVIVPVGSVLANMIVGTIISDLCNHYDVAIYQDKTYHIRHMNVVDMWAGKNG